MRRFAICALAMLCGPMAGLAHADHPADGQAVLTDAALERAVGHGRRGDERGPLQGPARRWLGGPHPRSGRPYGRLGLARRRRPQRPLHARQRRARSDLRDRPLDAGALRADRRDAGCVRRVGPDDPQYRAPLEPRPERRGDRFRRGRRRLQGGVLRRRDRREAVHDDGHLIQPGRELGAIRRLHELSAELRGLPRLQRRWRLRRRLAVLLRLALALQPAQHQRRLLGDLQRVLERHDLHARGRTQSRRGTARRAELDRERRPLQRRQRRHVLRAGRRQQEPVHDLAVPHNDPLRLRLQRLLRCGARARRVPLGPLEPRHRGPELPAHR